MDRDFKGVWIPKEVYLDRRLSALDKMIFVEVDSLSNSETGCYASNQYLADFCQCSDRKVSDAISRLIKYGYIHVENFDGRRRVLKSDLTVQGRQEETSNQTRKKCEADTQKVRESNNSNNNKLINKDMKEKSYISKDIYDKEKKANKVPPALEDVQEYCKERNNTIDAELFIDYYQARGWVLTNGKKMKDWKAAVRTWERNRKEKGNADMGADGEGCDGFERTSRNAEDYGW